VLNKACAHKLSEQACRLTKTQTPSQLLGCKEEFQLLSHEMVNCRFAPTTVGELINKLFAEAMFAANRMKPSKILFFILLILILWYRADFFTVLRFGVAVSSY
jgi:hypothetical protein